MNSPPHVHTIIQYISRPPLSSQSSIHAFQNPEQNEPTENISELAININRVTKVEPRDHVRDYVHRKQVTQEKEFGKEARHCCSADLGTWCGWMMDIKWAVVEEGAYVPP
jgi:hypothetical protein